MVRLERAKDQRITEHNKNAQKTRQNEKADVNVRENWQATGEPVASGI